MPGVFGVHHVESWDDGQVDWADVQLAMRLHVSPTVSTTIRTPDTIGEFASTMASELCEEAGVFRKLSTFAGPKHCVLFVVCVVCLYLATRKVAKSVDVGCYAATPVQRRMNLASLLQSFPFH